MKPIPQNNRILFTGVGVLHLAIGIGLFAGLPIDRVSSIAGIVLAIGIDWTALLMFAIGAMSLCSTLVTGRVLAFALLVSQQIVLVASGVAGVWCALEGHYADGTPADPWHIFADQLPYGLIMGMHSMAILQSHAPALWNRLTEGLIWLFWS